MYGRQKRNFIIFSILIIVVLIVGVVIWFINHNDNIIQYADLINIKYIGGDKYVDAELTLDDFEVTEKNTNQIINKDKLKLEAGKLSDIKNGTLVKITYISPDNIYSIKEITIYPTLAITEITATFLPTNKHIGSTISVEDFEVVGKNNKGEEIKLSNFTISQNLLESAENSIRINYTTSIGTIYTVLQINVSENFIKSLRAEYTGPETYIGDKIDLEKVKAYAIWDDNTETELTEYEFKSTEITANPATLLFSVTDPIGRVVTGELTVNAINYLIDIDSINYVGYRKTIGDTVDNSEFEVYGLMTDGSKKKISNFTISSNKTLTSAENKVVIEIINDRGETKSKSINVRGYKNLIIVGDSRVSSMKKYYNVEDSKIKDTDEINYVSSKNADLNWLKGTGISQIKDIINKDPYTKYRIVLNLGLHDPQNYEEYYNYYKTLLSTAEFKDKKIYILSILPINESKINQEKKYSTEKINNKNINIFNTNIKQLIDDVNIVNFTYINYYSEMLNSGYETTDGVNYDEITIEKILLGIESLIN